jgi:transposase
VGIVFAGFDVHRAQITFDALGGETGELRRGRIDATPHAVGAWAQRFADRELHVAMEATTGWLFVCRALQAAGAIVHLAEPWETSARRGRKRAKTDREDARLLRELLSGGRLPEAWVPPEHVRVWRSLSKLRNTLLDERTAWLQRVRATLFHHGIRRAPARLTSTEGREFLANAALPEDARERVDVALALVETIDRQLAPLELQRRRLARRQPGCRALMQHFGIGELTAPAILTELGDVSRLGRSRKAVRLAGIDIGVHRSDRHSRPGRLSKAGSPHLRWALYEAAESACRPTSPDHAAYLELRERMSHTRASLTIARKLARRAYHTLTALGPEALAPADAS